MKIQFYDNKYISSEAIAIDMALLDETWGDVPNLMIACDNEQVKQNLVNALSARYSPRRSFTAMMMNEALDEALVVEGKRVSDCSISLVLFHRAGVVTLQMGEGRIVQVRPHEKSAVYDSRDQVLDIYSSRAKVMELVDIVNGDYFIVTTAGRVNLNKVVEILSNATRSDSEKINAIETILNDGNAALLLQHIDKVEGTAGFSLPDMSGVWKTITGLLIIGVATLLVFNFAPRCSTTLGEGEVEEQSGVLENSVSTSDVARPTDAVEAVDDVVDDARDVEDKPQEKKEEKSDENKDSQKKEDVEKENGQSSAASTDEHETVVPTEPAPAPVTPPTEPQAEPTAGE